MERINHEELKTLLNLCFKAKQSLFVYGRPGIGKSVTVKEQAKKIAKQEGKEYKEWNALQPEEQLKLFKNRDKHFVLLDERVSEYSDTSDAKGLPDFIDTSKIDGELSDIGGRSVVWGGQLWVRYFAHPDAHGIIFLDEINNAPPSIQKACYKIVLDHQIGNMSFGDDIEVIGAGNRLQDKSNVFAMPKALDNRASHVELKVPTADDWIENYAMPNKLNANVIAYVKYKPSMLHKWSDKAEDKAYPSPRSMEMLSNLLDYAKNMKEIKLAANSTIGSGAAREFMAFFKVREEVDMEAIMKNPKKVKEIDDDRMDLKWAVASYVAEKYKADKKKLAKALEVANNLHPAEFKIQAARFIKNANEKHFKEAVTNSKDKAIRKVWDKMAGQVGKYLVYAD